MTLNRFHMPPVFHRTRHELIVNTEASLAIPPHAATEIDSIDYDVDTGEIKIKVKRPTADSLPANKVVFNSHEEIPAGGTDTGAGTIQFPAVGKCDAAPNAGELWGTKVDSFDLAKDNMGFYVIGRAGTGDSLALLRPVESLGIILAHVGATAIPAATGVSPATTPGSGTVDLLDSGNPTATIKSGVTVKNYLKTSSGTDRTVVCGWTVHGVLIYLADFCDT